MWGESIEAIIGESKGVIWQESVEIMWGEWRGNVWEVEG